MSENNDSIVVCSYMLVCIGVLGKTSFWQKDVADEDDYLSNHPECGDWCEHILVPDEHFLVCRVSQPKCSSTDSPKPSSMTTYTCATKAEADEKVAQLKDEDIADAKKIADERRKKYEAEEAKLEAIKTKFCEIKKEVVLKHGEQFKKGTPLPKGPQLKTSMKNANYNELIQSAKAVFPGWSMMETTYESSEITYYILTFSQLCDAVPEE